MFARPGLCGMGIGRLGLVAASQPSLVAQALAILSKYGSAANLYLPGVGAISGITAGNWLDSAGTTTATVDGQVGLVVSAGKTVGPELVSNGDFNSAVGWILAGTWSVSGGAAVANAAAPFSTVRQDSFPFEAGKAYLVTWSVMSVGSGGVRINFDGGTQVSGVNRTSPGVYTDVIVANAGNNSLRIQAISGGFTGSVDKVSVRELPGSHLIQATTANKPILRLSGGAYAWDFVSSDSFTSTLTPGNAGFFCAAANVTDSGVLRTLLGAGAGSDASSGVWLARAASNALTLQVGNGTTRNSVSAAYPVATNAVASAGWDASNMFVGINGTETSVAKSVNCTSANAINLGVLTGTTNPMLGTISGGAIIMPTVLPTATERATLRQLIASLSGVTL